MNSNASSPIVEKDQHYLIDNWSKFASGLQTAVQSLPPRSKLSNRLQDLWIDCKRIETSLTNANNELAKVPLYPAQKVPDLEKWIDAIGGLVNDNELKDHIVKRMKEIRDAIIESYGRINDASHKKGKKLSETERAQLIMDSEDYKAFIALWNKGESKNAKILLTNAEDEAIKQYQLAQELISNINGLHELLTGESLPQADIPKLPADSLKSRIRIRFADKHNPIPKIRVDYGNNEFSAHPSDPDISTTGGLDPQRRITIPGVSYTPFAEQGIRVDYTDDGNVRKPSVFNGVVATQMATLPPGATVFNLLKQMQEQLLQDKERFLGCS